MPKGRWGNLGVTRAAGDRWTPPAVEMDIRFGRRSVCRRNSGLC